VVPTSFFHTNLSILITMYDVPSTSDEFDKYDEPRLHMERLLRAKLVEFDISLRILCPLEKAGIRTLGDLVKRTHSDLRNISQLGKISVETLEKLLDTLGLSLAK